MVLVVTPYEVEYEPVEEYGVENYHEDDGETNDQHASVPVGKAAPDT